MIDAAQFHFPTGPTGYLLIDVTRARANGGLPQTCRTCRDVGWALGKVF